jgi:ribosomal protein S27E
LSRFDHASTRFVLTGSHRAVACADCHRPPNLETDLINVDFRKAPSTCEECHRDVHAGQFAAGAATTACANCHNSNKWKPSLFDHSRTRFPLEGVHKNVRCALCHNNIKVVSDSSVVFYKPTPVQCEACHGPAVTPTGGKT